MGTTLQWSRGFLHESVAGTLQKRTVSIHRGHLHAPEFPPQSGVPLEMRDKWSKVIGVSLTTSEVKRCSRSGEISPSIPL